MNHYMKIAVLLFLALIVSSACKSGSLPSGTANNGPQLSVTDNAGQFSDITDRDWFLIAVRLDSEIIELDRKTLTEQFNEIFTLRFDPERVSGVAAPNRYFGPYTQGDGQLISLGQMAGTLMAALFEPEVLKEHEFLGYLQNTYKWNIAGENLELYSKNEDGAEAVLVFVPAVN